MKTYRVVRKKKGGYFIGFDTSTPEKRDALFHTFFLLCPSPWYRRRRVPIGPKRAQYVEKLLNHADPLARQIGEAYARCWEQLTELQQVWTTFAEANRAGLTIDVTDHRGYEYARTRRLLNLEDDLDAPTPRPPALSRSQAVAGLLRRKPDLKQQEREAEYRRRRRDRNIEFQRPDLFADLEPYVRQLQAEHAAIGEELDSLGRLGKERLREVREQARFARESAEVADVLAGERALQALDRRRAPVDFLALDVHEDQEAKAEGRRRWRS